MTTRPRKLHLTVQFDDRAGDYRWSLIQTDNYGEHCVATGDEAWAMRIGAHYKLEVPEPPNPAAEVA